jgi:enoyl-[acyl-carrier protein] reductase I
LATTPRSPGCSGPVTTWPKFDGLVHSIGFAPREAHGCDFLDGLSREAFKIAHDISAYSFRPARRPCPPERQVGIADADLPGRCGWFELQHHGRQASLEASVLPGGFAGAKGHRVNGISAGPIRPGASGIKDFGKLLKVVADVAPIRRNVTIEDVGNVAAFLLSDLAGGVTAEITYVDGGYSHTAVALE